MRKKNVDDDGKTIHRKHSKSVQNFSYHFFLLIFHRLTDMQMICRKPINIFQTVVLKLFKGQNEDTMKFVQHFTVQKTTVIEIYTFIKIFTETELF